MNMGSPVFGGYAYNGYGSAGMGGVAPTQLYPSQGYVAVANNEALYSTAEASQALKVCSTSSKLQELEMKLRNNRDDGTVALKMFKEGLDAMKACEEARITAIQKAEADIAAEKQLIAGCAAERQTFVDWAGKVDALKAGFRPEKLDDFSLEVIATNSLIEMTATPSVYFCDKFHLSNWDQIKELDPDEDKAVIGFLSRKNFAQSKSFQENVDMYKEMGVIPPDFLEDTIQGGVSCNTKTRKAFIGIYVGKLPEYVRNYMFVKQKQSAGEDAECFVPKPSSGVPTFDVAEANSGSGFGGAPPANGGGGFGAAPPANGGGGFGAAPPANGGGGLFSPAPANGGAGLFGRP